MRIAIMLVGLGSVALLGYWIVQRGTLGWQKSPVDARISDAKLPRALPADAVAFEEVPAEIRAFCGDCHATPRPDRAPREAWEDEVRKGYERYKESDRHDLAAPPAAHVVAYYRRHARPATELRPPPCAPVEREGLRFERTDIVTPGGTRDPFVA
ncbi:MAG TPA: hypothetical protein VJ783_19680, partial [Pirellulales bacterium]|nr:hypothetical protein [Pirellulales bacterium]